jgi:hypothetical protein
MPRGNSLLLVAIVYTPKALDHIVSKSDLRRFAQIFFQRVRKITPHFLVSSECLIWTGDSPYFSVCGQILNSAHIGQF